MTDAEKERKDEIQADIKKYALLESVANSEGGIMIIKGLKADIVVAIDKLRASYKTASPEELKGWCAALDARINLLWAFERAPKNKKFAVTTLDELFKSVDADNDSV